SLVREAIVIRVYGSVRAVGHLSPRRAIRVVGPRSRADPQGQRGTKVPGDERLPSLEEARRSRRTWLVPPLRIRGLGRSGGRLGRLARLRRGVVSFRRLRGLRWRDQRVPDCAVVRVLG